MLFKFYDNTEGLWGYKDEHGQITIPALFERAEDFHEGLAQVENGIKTGAIDETGQIIIPFEYDSIWNNENWIHARKGDMQSLFSKNGDLLLSITAIISWNFPEEGIIRIKRTSGWGTINLNGTPIIPCVYQSLGRCLHGRLSYYEDGLWGWIEKTGNILIKAQFEQVGYWNHELWWGIMDGTYILYNFENEIIHNKGWLRIVEPDKKGAAVKTNDGWEFIDDQFNTTLKFPAVYEWVEFYSEGLAAVKRDGKWGFINTDLMEVISPIYKNASAFSEGLVSVRMDDMYGYIDTIGAIIIPFTYRSASSFKDGKAWVSDVYSRYQIDRNGTRVSEVESLWD